MEPLGRLPGSHSQAAIALLASISINLRLVRLNQVLPGSMLLVPGHVGT